MTTAPTTPALDRLEVRMEFKINAPRDKVWNAFVNEIGTWWPSDFVFTPGASMKLEARAGGRVYEANDDGAELLWGTILAIVPGEALNWMAPFSPPYAGPGTSYIHMSLEENDDNTTTFSLLQNYVGVPTENHRAQLEQGWGLLFDQALRAYVES